MHVLRAQRAERAQSFFFFPPFSALNARYTNKSKLSKAPREAAVAQPFLYVYSEILVRFSPCEAVRKVPIFLIFSASRVKFPIMSDPFEKLAETGQSIIE